LRFQTFLKQFWFRMFFFDLACLLRLLGRFFMFQNPVVVHTFLQQVFPNRLTCRSRHWCHITRIELPNYIVTMKSFLWGRYIGYLPSPPYHWSCMSDELLMWYNAGYSVHYAQRQVSASLWNARAFSRRSTYIKSVYKHYTVTDMEVTELT